MKLGRTSVGVTPGDTREEAGWAADASPASGWTLPPCRADPSRAPPRWACSRFALPVSSGARRPPRFSWPPLCGLPLRPSGPQCPDLPGKWQKSHEERVPCSLDATCTHSPCPRPACGSLNPSPGPWFHPFINQGAEWTSSFSDPRSEDLGHACLQNGPATLSRQGSQTRSGAGLGSRLPPGPAPPWGGLSPCVLSSPLTFLGVRKNQQAHLEGRRSPGARPRPMPTCLPEAGPAPQPGAGSPVSWPTEGRSVFHLWTLSPAWGHS